MRNYSGGHLVVISRFLGGFLKWCFRIAIGLALRYRIKPSNWHHFANSPKMTCKILSGNLSSDNYVKCSVPSHKRNDFTKTVSGKWHRIIEFWSTGELMIHLLVHFNNVLSTFLKQLPDAYIDKNGYICYIWYVWNWSIAWCSIPISLEKLFLHEDVVAY